MSETALCVELVSIKYKSVYNIPSFLIRPHTKAIEFNGEIFIRNPDFSYLSSEGWKALQENEVLDLSFKSEYLQK